MDPRELTQTQLEAIFIKAYCLFMDNEHNSTIEASIRLSNWISGYLNVNSFTAMNIMKDVFEAAKEVLK